ncbi:MAG: endonuclease/exonuclease/phosphatase family protein, partial [Candidatus Thiodiazotropha sp.]
MSILSWNVECLRTCLEDVEFISFVRSHDLFFCSETWQTANDSYEISGYKCIDVPRPSSLTVRKRNRGHGGICLFIRNELLDGITILEQNSDGFLWIKLDKQFFSLQSDICICFSYIPPKDSKYFKMFTVDPFETLEIGVRRYSEVGEIVIMGDLNARTGALNDFSTDSSLFDKYIDTLEGIESEFSSKLLTPRISMDTECNASGFKLLELCKGADLRICNGRLFDDADIGQFTYMSARGNSLIDYALITPTLSSFVSNFVIHDLVSYSPHRPIQLSLLAEKKISQNKEEGNTATFLKWDIETSETYKRVISENIATYQTITDKIVSSEVDIDNGINDFAHTLYNTAFDICGKSKPAHSSFSSDRYKPCSQWFTHECLIAKNELKIANRQFRNNRSQITRDLLVEKRRNYCKVKRRAKAAFNLQQKQRLHNLATNCPRKFWDEIKKFKNSKTGSNEIDLKSFYEHFRGLYSVDEPFSRDDVESKLRSSDEAFTESSSVLAEKITVDEVLRAVDKLKCNKSAGIDLLIPEIFIACKDIISPLLCKLFNFMFDNCVYPKSWS